MEQKRSQVKKAKSEAQMREIHININDPESIRVGMEQLKEDLFIITEDYLRERFKK